MGGRHTRLHRPRPSSRCGPGRLAQGEDQALRAARSAAARPRGLTAVSGPHDEREDLAPGRVIVSVAQGCRTGMIAAAGAARATGREVSGRLGSEPGPTTSPRVVAGRRRTHRATVP